MKVKFTHTINAPIEDIMDAYGDTDFYCEKQKASGAITVDILETKELENGNFWFKAKVSEPSRLPSFLRKSDVDTYTDDSTLDMNQKCVDWVITPGFGADKFVLRGKIEFEEAGDKTVVTYNTEMQINVPIVGKKAEKMGLAKTEDETEKQAAFLRKWLDV